MVDKPTYLILVIFFQIALDIELVIINFLKFKITAPASASVARN
jgi:hypothetical protein